MFNYFNLNFNMPFGMNNWFMPNLAFQNFLMPMCNMSFNWFNPFNISQMSMPTIFPTFNTYPDYSINTDYFVKSKKKIDFKKDNLKLDGYNAFKGEKLAKTALNNSVGWTGYCATYVKNAIQNSNLGLYQQGHAYQMSNILRNNGNFKEISPDGIDVSKLPAGCVLVYGKGKSGYSNLYGHTEITTGDGRAVSDGITKNLHKKPSAIFIPV